MEDEVKYILEIIEKQEKWLSECLPMIASENLTSGAQRRAVDSDFQHRYAEGKVGRRYYQGCEYIDEIEEQAILLTKKLFGAEHANVQPISGVNANLAAFFALTKPGDMIMALAVPHGGHISHAVYSSAGIHGLKVEHHPFDFRSMNIEPEIMARRIRENKPSLVVFGASLFLFPHPVEEARDACEEVGARIYYDGAHVMGLIAGKQFQDPLHEGADVLGGSTHKTFPGPQGAMLLCSEDVANEIDHAVFPGTTSNHHLHHVAALAIALAEMLEFGEQYAHQTVANARKLAASLKDRNFSVLGEDHHFTDSHQVALDVSNNGGGTKTALALEQANIIANKNLLPWDIEEKLKDPSGLRLGTQELTRVGMKEKEMEKVADFIERVAVNGENPEKVKKEVVHFRSEYQTVQYCFDHSSN
jgi:glycine hydroxymethyltransferase